MRYSLCPTVKPFIEPVSYAEIQNLMHARHRGNEPDVFQKWKGASLSQANALDRQTLGLGPMVGEGFEDLLEDLPMRQEQHEPGQRRKSTMVKTLSFTQAAKGNGNFFKTKPNARALAFS